MLTALIKKEQALYSLVMDKGPIFFNKNKGPYVKIQKVSI